MSDQWNITLKGYRKTRTFYHSKFYCGEIFHPIYGIVGLKKQFAQAHKAKDWAQKVATKLNSIQESMDEQFSASYLAVLGAIEELDSQGKELDNEVIRQIAVETDQQLAEIMLKIQKFGIEDKEGAENANSIK